AWWCWRRVSCLQREQCGVRNNHEQPYTVFLKWRPMENNEDKMQSQTSMILYPGQDIIIYCKFFMVTLQYR
ncbi:hypothetical protein DPEC_G00225150, partial [Dallia pectoralis]